MGTRKVVGRNNVTGKRKIRLEKNKDRRHKNATNRYTWLVRAWHL